MKYKHKMVINQTISIGILKNDLIYIILEKDKEKQKVLFNNLYNDISKNLVPVRPDMHYKRIKGQYVILRNLLSLIQLEIVFLIKHWK